MAPPDPPDSPTLTRRAALVRDQVAHPPLGARRASGTAAPVRVGVTGTGTELLVLAWSAAELAAERAAGARLLAALGVHPGMPVANALPGALATPGALLLGDVVEALGALDVPLGVIESAAAAGPAWALFDRVRPRVLVLDATSAAPLLAAVPPVPRPWWQGIVWLRRGTAPAAAHLFVPEAAGFRGWQRSWLAVPEVTSFVAWSCHAGGHHLDPGVAAEVVDGTLVLTALASAVSPRRYVSDVGARGLATTCRCGQPGPVVELT